MRYFNIPVPPKWLTILAFGVIYILWGSNFIAIRFAIDSIPPFLMAGSRFLIAGLALYVWNRINRESLPSLKKSIPSVKQGLWLNVLGTGGLVWSEQYVPSGLASIVVAMVPVWMVVLDIERWKQTFTRPAVLTGLALGITGVFLLSDYGSLGNPDHDRDSFYAGLTVLLLGTICWAYGSLMPQKGKKDISLSMSLAIQMISAGLVLLATGIGLGEYEQFSLSGVTSVSIFALAHLIIFGSIIGYLAYLWLLKEYSPALVGTYAYIHPLVAVFLGWMLAGEPVTTQTLVSMIFILMAVFLIKYAHPASESKSSPSIQTKQ